MKHHALPLLAAAALACSIGPARAQYKVVGPDGRVTYTDRPPPAAEGKALPMGREARPAAGETAADGTLPADLRQVAARFPVTLYVSRDCSPCDEARQLLQGRGVPYTEQRVTSEEDAEAMTRLTGGRVVPTLTIGSQALRGLAEADWNAYLDAAGYPREGRLPRNYAAPQAKPLAERKVVPRAAAKAAAAASAAAAETAAAPAAPPPPSPTGIRF